MPQPFPPYATLLARLGLGAVLAVLPAAALLGAWYVRSAWYTGAGVAPQQPVPFSHAHHVGEDGIDCRYCHTTVEVSASAGLPATDTCMSCHSHIWNDAPMLAPVRRSLVRGEPLAWQRVHDLPDFVYFDHSVHVGNGVPCVACHGSVDRMPLTRQVHSLQMGWCLECHRDPAPHLRPPQGVFDPAWEPPTRGGPSPSALMAHYGIVPRGLTDCSVCHR
jgi:hypothetical protein